MENKLIGIQAEGLFSPAVGLPLGRGCWSSVLLSNVRGSGVNGNSCNTLYE